MTEITNITAATHPEVWSLLEAPAVSTIAKTRIGMIREIGGLLSKHLSGIGYDK